MQQFNEPTGPNKKGPANTESNEEQNMEEGVYLYNEDGTPMDTSERTYVSVDLPNDDGPDTTSDDVE